MNTEPMPEVLDVDYLATFEWVRGDVESTNVQDSEFLDRLYDALAATFPNASVNVRLDGVQYATRGTQIVIDDSLIATDENPLDVVAWAEEVCDQIASSIGSEVFTGPDEDYDLASLPDDEQLLEDEANYSAAVYAGLNLR
jgi:hypothetical protein